MSGSALTDAADNRYSQVRRVTLIGAALDLVLAVLKIVVGFIATSQALIADGVHSLSDLATDAMVLLAAKHGSRAADADHPYGHRRIETVATVILGVALILVAAGIAWDAGRRLFSPEDLLIPGVAALVVAAVSVFAKEWIYRYTMRVAKRVNSAMLKANAWHSRSDAISSIVVVIGVAGTMAGLPYLDAVAAVVVALMIARIGWGLGWQSLHELIDTALEAERVEAIRRTILSVDGVRACHMLRTRRMGGDALVDVHVLVDPKLSVSEGHFISETVYRRLVQRIDEVEDVLVHIDPEDDEAGDLSSGLPARGQVLDDLRQCWEAIPERDAIQRLTLHYLHGRISVEATLPLECASDPAAARELAERLSRAAADLPYLRSIEVFYR